MVRTVLSGQLQDLKIFDSTSQPLQLCRPHQEQLREDIATDIDALVRSRFFQKKFRALFPSDRTGAHFNIRLTNHSLIVQLMREDESGRHLNPEGQALAIDLNPPENEEVIEINGTILDKADTLFQKCQNEHLHSHRSASAPSLRDRALEQQIQGLSEPLGIPPRTPAATIDQLAPLQEHIRHLEQQIQRLSEQIRTPLMTTTTIVPAATTLSSSRVDALEQQCAQLENRLADVTSHINSLTERNLELASLTAPSPNLPRLTDEQFQMLTLLAKQLEDRSVRDREGFPFTTHTQFLSLPQEVRDSVYFQMYSISNPTRVPNVWKCGENFFFNQEGLHGTNGLRALAITRYQLQSLANEFAMLGNGQTASPELAARFSQLSEEDQIGILRQHQFLHQQSHDPIDTTRDSFLGLNDSSATNEKRTEAISRYLQVQIRERYGRMISELTDEVIRLSDELDATRETYEKALEQLRIQMTKLSDESRLDLASAMFRVSKLQSDLESAHNQIAQLTRDVSSENPQIAAPQRQVDEAAEQERLTREQMSQLTHIGPGKDLEIAQLRIELGQVSEQERLALAESNRLTIESDKKDLRISDLERESGTKNVRIGELEEIIRKLEEELQLARMDWAEKERLHGVAIDKKDARVDEITLQETQTKLARFQHELASALEQLNVQVKDNRRLTLASEKQAGELQSTIVSLSADLQDETEKALRLQQEQKETSEQVQVLEKEQKDLLQKLKDTTEERDDLRATYIKLKPQMQREPEGFADDVDRIQPDAEETNRALLEEINRLNRTTKELEEERALLPASRSTASNPPVDLSTPVADLDEVRKAAEQLEKIVREISVEPIIFSRLDRSLIDGYHLNRQLSQVREMSFDKSSNTIKVSINEALSKELHLPQVFTLKHGANETSLGDEFVLPKKPEKRRNETNRICRLLLVKRLQMIRSELVGARKWAEESQATPWRTWAQIFKKFTTFCEEMNDNFPKLRQDIVNYKLNFAELRLQGIDEPLLKQSVAEQKIPREIQEPQRGKIAKLIRLHQTMAESCENIFLRSLPGKIPMHHAWKILMLTNYGLPDRAYNNGDLREAEAQVIQPFRSLIPEFYRHFSSMLQSIQIANGRIVE